jgi:hypothetical protein
MDVMGEPRRALDGVVDGAQADTRTGTVIALERDGSPTRRWVRYLMPVMVEVDCDVDRVRRVVTLPEEIRADRDDVGHFCVYDERFVRRPDDAQPQVHAFCVARPQWEHHLRVGPPANWSKTPQWEEGFDIAADDTYAQIHPYAHLKR